MVPPRRCSAGTIPTLPPRIRASSPSDYAAATTRERINQTDLGPQRLRATKPPNQTLPPRIRASSPSDYAAATPRERVNHQTNLGPPRPRANRSTKPLSRPSAAANTRAEDYHQPPGPWAAASTREQVYQTTKTLGRRDHARARQPTHPPDQPLGRSDYTRPTHPPDQTLGRSNYARPTYPPDRTTLRRSEYARSGLLRAEHADRTATLPGQTAVLPDHTAVLPENSEPFDWAELDKTFEQWCVRTDADQTAILPDHTAVLPDYTAALPENSEPFDWAELDETFEQWCVRTGVTTKRQRGCRGSRGKKKKAADQPDPAGQANATGGSQPNAASQPYAASQPIAAIAAS